MIVTGATRMEASPLAIYRGLSYHSCDQSVDLISGNDLARDGDIIVPVGRRLVAAIIGHFYLRAFLFATPPPFIANTDRPLLVFGNTPNADVPVCLACVFKFDPIDNCTVGIKIEADLKRTGLRKIICPAYDRIANQTFRNLLAALNFAIEIVGRASLIERRIGRTGCATGNEQGHNEEARSKGFMQFFSPGTIRATENH
ncbi:MAG: hypothetical protein P1V21_09025 [Rhizobiaceae bacterium]|nr:hypothetical protein [Rhizobiaceae bacterium]